MKFTEARLEQSIIDLLLILGLSAVSGNCCIWFSA